MELKPGVGSNTAGSCSGPLNKSPAISGFLHPRLSREAWKHSQTSAPAEARTFPGATPSPRSPVVRGGGRPEGAAVVLGLGSAVREDLGSALRACDGARRPPPKLHCGFVRGKGTRPARAACAHQHTPPRAAHAAHTPPRPGERDRPSPAPSAPDHNPPKRTRHRPRGPAAP